MEYLDVSDLEKSSEMLDEERFWTIVSKSLENAEDEDAQEAALMDELMKLSPKEMISFDLRTCKLLYDTYTPELWCAGYILNTGCSDDGFEYFRRWIISRGKATYYQAKENPDSLIDEVSDDKDYYEFEGFMYVVIEAFLQKTGADLYDFIDYDTFQELEGNYPEIAFNWEEDKPETMKKICPKLFERFWQEDK